MKRSSPHSRNNIEFFIKENSWIAKMSAKKLHAGNMAIALGKTIHLWNVSASQFLQNERWVKHELCHIKQFRQHGFISFICKYLAESIRHGYHENRYEREARAAEK